MTLAILLLLAAPGVVLLVAAVADAIVGPEEPS